MFATAAASLMAAALLAGCGSSGDDKASSEGGSSGDDTSSSEGGTLNIAAFLEAPPFDFIEDGKPTGFDIELSEAIAEKLGKKLEVHNTGFAAIITSVAGGRYDFGISGTYDTPEREQQVDFVSYAASPGSFLLVQKGNPSGITVNDLCGHKLGNLTGAIEVPRLEAASKACTDAGKPAIDLTVYTSITSIYLAIKNGTIDGTPISPPMGVYTANNSDGAFEVIRETVPGFPGGIYGIMVKKDNKELQEQIQGAVNDLIEDGTYGDIFKKWDVEYLAVTESLINAATTS